MQVCPASAGPGHSPETHRHNTGAGECAALEPPPLWGCCGSRAAYQGRLSTWWGSRGCRREKKVLLLFFWVQFLLQKCFKQHIEGFHFIFSIQQITNIWCCTFVLQFTELSSFRRNKNNLLVDQTRTQAQYVSALKSHLLSAPTSSCSGSKGHRGLRMQLDCHVRDSMYPGEVAHPSQGHAQTNDSYFV